MYNTSAFAQNLQKVTRIHQRCSLHVELMLKFWLLKVHLALVQFWLQCQLFAHMLAHFAHVVHCFYSSRKQASNSSVQHQYISYCILLEHCCPRNFHPMTSHGTVGWLVMRCSSLLRQARSELRKRWNWCNVFSTAFSQAWCSCSLRGCRQESRAHGVVGNMTAFQLERPRQCQRPQRPELSLRSLRRQKPRKPGFAWHSPWLVVMVLKFVSLGGLERLVRYLSFEAHFNLQTCIWNILECCSFRSLTWSCWGFPVNQSASEFPVRSLDCKIVHDLQNWKEAEHCFWMKGEIGCTWWSALLSVLHIENIATRKRFWRGPSISTQMTLIATQSNNWSIYRVYALCLWCEDFRYFFSLKSGLIVFSWIQAAELLLDSWQPCAGLNTSGITEKGNVWFDLMCPGDELTMNWCFF